MIPSTFAANMLSKCRIRPAQLATTLGACSRSLHLTTKTINPCVINSEYAVRGPLVQLAEDIQRQGKEVIFCNIGNPQALGQHPLTFARQYLSLALNASLLDPVALPHTRKLFSSDVIARVQKGLSRTPGGFGAYSHSQGLRWIREEVADFISQRDGVDSDPNSIFLGNGASDCVSKFLNLVITDQRTGCLVPVPQYPLYSATLALLGGRMIPYYLDEERQWGLTPTYLDKALQSAKKQGVTVRAMVVINPGNPTGQLLTQDDMSLVIDYCKRNHMVLMADEVYQENVYQNGRKFTSFRNVLKQMGPAYEHFELCSFHSTSKGYMGECGLRGGYMEAVNMDPEVHEQLYKVYSIGLCCGLPGQLMVSAMVNPPKPGDESYPLFVKERDAVIASLRRRAAKVVAGLNKMEGVTCNMANGAMYVFPQLRLSRRAVAEAKKRGVTPDDFYAYELLQTTGICVVPGSGFGQKEGTVHFRSTFLPPEDRIDAVMSKFQEFHRNFMSKYRD